jgi:septal ring factor EnvC (AmiA/AmiB activator)
MIRYFLAVILIILGPITAARAQEATVLAETERKINQSIEEQVRLSAEKEEIEKQITELQEKLKTRRKLITLRLKAQNRLRSFQWGELLLNNNLNDLNRDLKILSNLNHYDLELFKDYRQSIEMLAQARKNLADTQLQIKNNIAVLQQRQEDFKTLESVRINILTKENSSSFLLHKGHIARPLDGKLIQSFGNLRDQIRQFYLINYGELYSAPKSTAVKSIGPGVVIFRDLLGRWRETLIVQHSDDYYSVYAGVLPRPEIKVGEKIEAGTVIGATFKSEFYFELRHFANPINPATWYKEIK